MIRILIADDSKQMRQLLRYAIAQASDMAVVGEAVNGRDAVEKAIKLQPDFILLDMVMPVTHGLETLSQIMVHCPVPVLALSSHAKPQSSQSALRAIELGALDVMAKPPQGEGDRKGWIKPFIEKIRLLSQIHVVPHFRGWAGSGLRAGGGGNREASPSIVAIGATAGGPGSVLSILKALPRDCSACCLVVQHMATGFDAGFVRWLDRECPMPVQLAQSGDKLCGGTVFVAPSDHHMEVIKGAIRLVVSPPVHTCRPSADLLFGSLARHHAPEVLAVLLGGKGGDGVAGIKMLQEGGGRFIIQKNEGRAESTVLSSARDMLPLEKIPSAVSALLSSPETAPM